MEDLPPLPESAEEYLPQRGPAWITWLIIVSTVGVFLVQLIAQHRYGGDPVADALAFSPEAWADHRYWTLLTYAWAHATAMFGDPGFFWLHIVANMIPVYCLGPALEDALGHLRYLALYLGGAIAAALVWFFFSANGDPGESIIGASGAVFALITAAGTLAPRERIVVYLFFVLPLKMNLRTLALLLCGLELAQIVFRWLPAMAHTAHLGGAAFGFLFILALSRLFRRD